MSTQLEPVSAEDLARLEQLKIARGGMANRLLDLEEEKIKILAATKRVSDEWNGLLARIAQERGIDPNSHFEVNPRTGQVMTGAPEVPENSGEAEKSPAEAAPEAEG